MAGMKTQHVERIFLIGPTGAGKTTVGRTLADLLGWQFADTDDLVAASASKTIHEIFAVDGEPRFREMEGAALAEAASRVRHVVATGAGIVERVANRDLMMRSGWVVHLACSDAVVLGRLDAEARAAGRTLGDARPLLATADPLARLGELAARRSAAYGCSDDAVPNEALPPLETARLVLAGLVGRGLLSPCGAVPVERTVAARSGGYAAAVAWGGLATLAERLPLAAGRARAYVVADANVLDFYQRPLHESFDRAGVCALIYSVPPGEQSKSSEQLNAIYDWLAEERAERSDLLVAIGGGVVGDLAGFAAATYLRGMPLAHVPTSLLAQVDSSIGGKTGINHTRGKNLIGAFHTPQLVIADPALLLTLPPRQRIEGWAEVVKHGVALDAEYFGRVERDVEALLSLQPAQLTATIAGSVAIKVGIAEGDERESEGGRRHLLNYGHTIGHAIEAVAGYGAWLHGEAVSVGMVVAARLGRRLGVTPEEVVVRQEALLARFGLPIRADGLALDALLHAVQWDKKVHGGAPRWVLPTRLGTSTLVGAVSEAEVRAALLEVGAT
jgi:3-dehydroquinate synthase